MRLHKPRRPSPPSRSPGSAPVQGRADRSRPRAYEPAPTRLSHRVGSEMRSRRSPPPQRRSRWRARSIGSAGVGRASVEHLYGARLVAWAVIEEVGKLLLRLQLVLDIARALQALGACDGRHDGGEVGKLLGLERRELIAGLSGLKRAGRGLARRDQRIDLSAGAVEVLHGASLHAHGVLEAGERVLPAGLRAGEELLAGCRTGIALSIALRERLIDGGDA